MGYQVAGVLRVLKIEMIDNVIFTAITVAVNIHKVRMIIVDAEVLIICTRATDQTEQGADVVRGMGILVPKWLCLLLGRGGGFRFQALGPGVKAITLLLLRDVN